MDRKYTRLKWACYTANITMSAVASITPILLLTFHNLYDISYSLLGLLVLINFVSQLIIDLVFSFFSHKFSIEKTVKIMPVLAIFGLTVYAALPFFFPNIAYLGLVLGTIVFSVSSGLAEVLVSPVIAAIPSEYPDREMSKLHSVYAWGVVGVVIFSTVFLNFFGKENWFLLVILFSLIPLISALLYSKSEIPRMKVLSDTSGALSFLKDKTVWVCVAAIFFGGAAECTMSQWCSSYLEGAMKIPKVWGDIFGMALFALTLGLGRTLYTKFGKNISKILFFGAVGAVVCYLLATLSPFPILSLLGCGLTGLCTSMLWPGNLIVASDRFEKGGVFIFALMAAGGDLGASLGPQVVGIVTDTFLSLNFSEQMSMRAGLLCAIIFPLCAVFVFAYIMKKFYPKR